MPTSHRLNRALMENSPPRQALGPISQSYRERPHEGVLQGTGPALSPTFKTQHKSQSAGAAQGWARARQGRHLPVLQN